MEQKEKCSVKEVSKKAIPDPLEPARPASPKKVEQASTLSEHHEVADPISSTLEVSLTKKADGASFQDKLYESFGAEKKGRK